LESDTWWYDRGVDGELMEQVARVLALIADRDPDVLAAAEEVDRSLLAWSLAQTPRQRLDACSNAARTLARFRRATSPDR
jgi:hypothetical protein